ncbi:hypothetical protein COW36_11035 [bacterium (Candidatus Blackallbacteria) CG17_big_fil_post_rev_8_21_14_2_50_48_46]|uniref:DUF4829 domain-containing protein n=1 Tax=bacterium (Candidatus Blackallbacteria) CG17_big_fil_post_rev_8_21_14_2_50_48_46 TaxID=2014261 RepID=A0A2M7G4I4_9BACT|nr:MAG: hypothetical protein COW64_18130 [bacterium (Candidatus Blackallbacteria) CG18_big_fil_WC_8_21_14_2_50_49_26]PIW16809.1 MAG: hypothetical protein COW36_11035 [bacterium (Candidatus Blackallbacteria) CG17_big_fil_post_rev_8_21_14_2_50_48_46]PIW48006.1 MAG: hypothetical protein COW20_10750 [bacterium (Candidatus Blackallbacteria) CG13_big_fil_rev_8_21_14_2_50_49_14]
MKKWISGLAVCLILATQSGCLQKTIALEDDHAEKAAAYAVAKSFIQEFSQLHLKEALAYATVPFTAEGEVYKTQEALESEFQDEFENEKPLEIKILAMRFYTLEDLRLFKTQAYQRLVKNGFDSHYIVLAELEIEGDADVGFLILKRMENGVWKIAGVDH